MKQSTRSLIIAAVVGAVATFVLTLGLFAGGILLSTNNNGAAQAAALPQTQTTVDADDLVAAYEQALINVYDDTLPSVVNIRVTKAFDRSNFDNPELPKGFDPPEGVDPEDVPEFFNQGGGSGFVWDDEGHIVTNHHVIAGATKIEVLFADDTAVDAELVGSDPDSDLAVIKVDLPASYLQPAKLGDSDTLKVGQISIAIGNPFSQDFTMTSGIISGVGRTIRGGNSGFSIPEVIQTDAPINPGNSGGPLFNRQGEVLGINSQIISRSGSSSGIGFAVPINIAKDVVPTLIDGQTVEYAWLGIQGNTVTIDMAEFRGIDPGGAVVVAVAEDGPADAAGLQGRDDTLDQNDEAFRFGGDIITAIDGSPISDMTDLISYLVSETDPGDVVTLDVVQADGTATQIEVELGVRPSSGN